LKLSKETCRTRITHKANDRGPQNLHRKASSNRTTNL